MTTTSRLIILAAFLTGSALGYLDLLSPGSAPAADTAASGMPVKNNRAPELRSSQTPGNTSLPLPNEKNMNMLLMQYADFSLQETRDELNRLLKQIKEDKKNYNFHIYEAISYLAFKLGSLSPEDARQFLQNKDQTIHRKLYGALLEGWAQNNFQGAMDYLLTHKKESDQSLRTFNILSENLAKKDPDKALQWLTTLTPGERSVAVQAMSEAIPLNHPEKMSGFLALIDAKKHNWSDLYGKMAKAWATTDWDAAKAWIDTLKGSKKSIALSTAIGGLSKNNLAKATEELKKTDQSSRSFIASSILQNFSATDIAQGKSLDWLMENKDSFAHPEFIVSGCVYSSEYMTPEMNKKVLQLPDEKIKDAALQTMVFIQSNMAAGGHDYAGDTRETAFSKVLDLAAHINDPQKRNAAAKNCVNDWIRQSPEEARQWLTEKSTLPDKDKQELFKNCDARLKEQTKQNS